MSERETPARLRLHRLRLIHESDPDWPLEPEPLLPGVLEVDRGSYAHLMFCPDVVTLVTSLWNRQPYGARGQMVRPVLAPGGGPDQVRLEVVWAAGSELLCQVPLATWQRQVTRLAGQAAEVLTAAGERSLLMLLSAALAGGGTGTTGPVR